MRSRLAPAAIPSTGARYFGTLAVATAWPLAQRSGEARAARTPKVLGSIKAMTFGIQGTVVDYYQPFACISAALEIQMLFP
jgi:hypothetical protein